MGKKKNQQIDETKLMAVKASRNATGNDVAAGFNNSPPILSSRPIKKSRSPDPLATTAKSGNSKRKFTFGKDLFNNEDAASSRSTKNVGESKCPISKPITHQNKRKAAKPKNDVGQGHQISKVKKGKRVAKMQTEKPVQKPKSYSPNDGHISSDPELSSLSSADPITSDQNEWPVVKAFSNSLSLLSQILPQRGAATIKKSLKEVSSSEIDVGASPKKKETSRSAEKDGEYAERQNSLSMTKELEAFKTFDIPVLKKSFQGPLIDMTKYKIKETEIIPLDKQKCPIGMFCNSLIPKILPPRLAQALVKHNDLKARCAAGEVTTDAVVAARDSFCNLHHAEETIIPQGIQAGYRDSIDFANEIAARLSKPQHAKRFYDIIHKTVQSSFLHDILALFAEIGQVKARGAEVQMLGAVKSQCGYYGNTGYSWIFKFLLDTYRADSSSPLKPSLAHPLTLIEFIQLVLIPEAALVLIAEDYKLDLEKAKDIKRVLKILSKSSEFGQVMYPDSQDDLIHSISKRHHVI